MPTLGSLTEPTFSNLDGALDGTRDQSDDADVGSTSADALILTIKVTPTSTGGSASGYVDLFMAEGNDALNTNLSAGASGSDAAYAPTGAAQQIKNARFIGRLAVDGSTTDSFEGTYVVPGPIARFIAFITENQVGVDLSSTAGNNYVKFQTVDY